LTEKNNATDLSAVQRDAPSFKPENPADKEFQEPPRLVSQRLDATPKETANLLPLNQTKRRSAEKPMEEREPATLSLVFASRNHLISIFN